MYTTKDLSREYWKGSAGRDSVSGKLTAGVRETEPVVLKQNLSELQSIIDGEDNADRGKEYLEHIRKLLRDRKVPELQEEYSNEALLKEIHYELKAIREVMFAFSAGDFSPDITARGVIPGGLKTLQAHLRHLIWQAKMVEKGDFSQKIHFMGEVSDAFNGMILKLNESLAELREKEQKLKESEAKFKFLASHDPLTGILNRRSFIELANIELAHASLRDIQCCLAMMDIDNFKRFNDTYGHPAGDKALRHTVKTIESELRKNDFMGRYGGEEFIFFFFGADEHVSLGVLERLRKSLAEKPVPLENGNVQITASFGLVSSAAENSKDKDYINKLIQNADAALYAAKREGRNRIVLYTP